MRAPMPDQEQKHWLKPMPWQQMRCICVTASCCAAPCNVFAASSDEVLQIIGTPGARLPISLFMKQMNCRHPAHPPIYGLHQNSRLLENSPSPEFARSTQRYSEIESLFGRLRKTSKSSVIFSWSAHLQSTTEWVFILKNKQNRLRYTRQNIFKNQFVDMSAH